MCSTMRRPLNKKTNKYTQNKCDKAMAVPILAYGSEIWSITGRENMQQIFKLQK
jgi:hypothetical protein